MKGVIGMFGGMVKFGGFAGMFFYGLESRK